MDAKPGGCALLDGVGMTVAAYGRTRFGSHMAAGVDMRDDAIRMRWTGRRDRGVDRRINETGETVESRILFDRYFFSSTREPQSPSRGRRRETARDESRDEKCKQ